MRTFQHNKKNKQVKNVFNQVFDKYDLMNDLMSAGCIGYGKNNLSIG